MRIIETAARSGRLITASALVLITALAWAYVWHGAGMAMDDVSMTTWQFPPPVPAAVMTGPWDAAYWAMMTAMWAVMMVAMMTPSAAPMILLYGRVASRAQERGQMRGNEASTGLFAAGYFICWLLFSLAATVLQWFLEQRGVLDGMMLWPAKEWLPGVLLMAAGVYQFTPLKAVCLQNCRAPAEFLSRSWRKGRMGALYMGLWHGLFCLGCCWALMALLFAGGVMNLVWIAGLSILVLIEKLAPAGRIIGQAGGVVMGLTGAYLLLA